MLVALSRPVLFFASLGLLRVLRLRYLLGGLLTLAALASVLLSLLLELAHSRLDRVLREVLQEVNKRVITLF